MLNCRALQDSCCLHVRPWSWCPRTCGSSGRSNANESENVEIFNHFLSKDIVWRCLGHFAVIHLILTRHKPCTEYIHFSWGYFGTKNFCLFYRSRRKVHKSSYNHHTLSKSQIHPQPFSFRSHSTLQPFFSNKVRLENFFRTRSWFTFPHFWHSKQRIKHH